MESHRPVNEKGCAINEDGPVKAVKSDQIISDKQQITKQVPVWTQEAQIQTERIPSLLEVWLRKNRRVCAGERLSGNNNANCRRGKGVIYR